MEIKMHSRRRIVTIALTAAMIIGCWALLGSGAYAAEKPANVTKLKCVSGYESVILSWKAVAGANGYVIMKDGEEIVTTVNGEKCKDEDVKKRIKDNKYQLYFDAFPEDTKGKAKTATFDVYAYAEDETGRVMSDEPATIEDAQPIHPMYVVVETRYSSNLYPSATSNNASRTVPSNTKLVAFGGSRQNGGNKRVIVRYKNKVYYVRAENVSTKKMLYNSKTKYSKKDVESFMNDAKVKPNKKTLHGTKAIWVNTYNQRVYLFEWNYSKKRWETSVRYPRGILANTGQALTPYGLFHVSSKWERKESTGTMWWCIFNSVGIHEKLGDALGKPASGGCVRIPDADARWFYFNTGKGTPVFVY